MPITAEIRSILVATGLGGESDAPIRLAGQLAERAGAALHLLHALELPAVPAGVEEEPRDFRSLVRLAGKELEAQASRAVPAGLEPASAEVAVFVPHKAILNRALQVSADLIVLGAHRRRPRGDQLLGPTPDRVIRSAAAPCLIVPETEPRPFRTIVAPIDLQMPAASALDLARVWAARFGVSNHGVTEIHALAIAPGSSASEGSTAKLEAALNREIERSRSRIGEDDAVTSRPVVRYGSPPADEILRYLEEVDADLVVLGTRGFGAIRRALIGSVASTIGRRAPCPVLLVPPVLWRGEQRR